MESQFRDLGAALAIGDTERFVRILDCGIYVFEDGRVPGEGLIPLQFQLIGEEDAMHVSSSVISKAVRAARSCWSGQLEIKVKSECLVNVKHQ